MSAESKKHLSQSARRNIVTALLNLEGAVVLALGVFVLYLDLTKENISVAGSVDRDRDSVHSGRDLFVMVNLYIR